MSGSIDTLIDLHDSDIITIEKVAQVINAKQGRMHSLEAFRVEIIERFAEVGFKVDVRTFTTDQPGLYSFEIEIADRLEGEFDPDRMVHEAVNDLLELGEGGVIKSSGLIVPGGDHGHKH